ncbi:MAG: cytochrome P460 family protein [Bacteroidales bacterium]
MYKRKLNVLSMFVLVLSVLIFSSCNKDDELEGIDKELYDMASSSSGYTWFENSSAYLDKSSGSGHNYPFLRTRFNATAASRLDSTGRIYADTTFPEGSMIVKELYDGSKGLERYAILYKQSNNSNADANGWVWGYINSDETVAVSATEKGNACIGCHTQAGNIDYMLMNKFFP